MFNSFVYSLSFTIPSVKSDWEIINVNAGGGNFTISGAISGAVRSRTGRVLVVKGDTHTEKTLHTEYTERDDGSVAETRILTDRFVPVIRAWDMTPGSPTRGEVLTIR